MASLVFGNTILAPYFINIAALNGLGYEGLREASRRQCEEILGGSDKLFHVGRVM